MQTSVAEQHIVRKHLANGIFVCRSNRRIIYLSVIGPLKCVMELSSKCESISMREKKNCHHLITCFTKSNPQNRFNAEPNVQFGLIRICRTNVVIKNIEHCLCGKNCRNKYRPYGTWHLHLAHSHTLGGFISMAKQLYRNSRAINVCNDNNNNNSKKNELLHEMKKKRNPFYLYDCLDQCNNETHKTLNYARLLESRCAHPCAHCEWGL